MDEDSDTAAPRHDDEPLQVLPMDPTNGRHHVHVRGRGAKYRRRSGLCNGREPPLYRPNTDAAYGGECKTDVDLTQGKWDFRAKRRGDVIAEF